MALAAIVLSLVRFVRSQIDATEPLALAALGGGSSGRSPGVLQARRPS